MTLDPTLIKMVLAGAGMAAAGAVLYQIRAIPRQIYAKVKSRLIYSVKIYQYDELFDMLEQWLANHHEKQYRDVEATIGSTNLSPIHVIVDNNPVEINYKQEENTFFLKYKGKRILISKSKEKIEKAQTSKEMYFRKYLIRGIKAKSAIDSLLKEAIQEASKKKVKNSIRIASNTSYGEWYNGSTVKIKPISKTIINPTKKEYIISDVDKFIANEAWYAEVCVPYKRGYCFYGPPGTGKTTLALAIANYTKRNIYCLNLNSIEDDSRLPRCFAEIPSGSILLIEDVDKVFSGRENVKEGSKITFSSLLNCLDGAFYKHDLITIITTNHLDKLDEALLRTGRIDVKMEIPKPGANEINQYFETFFNLPLNIQGGFDLKMSDVQEICLRHRLCPELAKEELTSKLKN